MKHFIAIMATLALSQIAYADPPDNRPPETDVGSSAIADAAAYSASLSASTSESSSDSVSASGANAHSGDATVESGDYSAWALSIPGATSAPAVALECMTHTSGWSLGPVFSKSGKTVYNAECVAFKRCITIVSTYARLGEKHMALDALESCSLPQLD